jgi:ferric-dicitrate binding protein FerR (iron transport regulator)
MTRAASWTVGLALCLAAAPAVARAETPHRIGLVTRVTGEASVVRQGKPEPQALRFKDDVHSGDALRTAPASVLRVLLYGTTLLAAGESSAVRVVDARGRTTIDLDAGKLSVVVTQSAGRPDDLVEIRTPNAVATLRGTSIVAEVAAAVTSLYVLSGTVDVRAADAARPVTLRAFQAVSVTASGPGAVQTLAPDVATRLMQDFRLTPQHTAAPETAVKSIGERGQTEAEEEARVLRRQGVKGVPGGLDPSRRPVVPIQPQIPAGQGPRACC